MMIKFVVKEATLLIAFVVLGTLLLLGFWVAHNVNESLVRDFRNAQISVVLRENSEPTFKTLVEKNSNVTRYDLFSAEKNKRRIIETYPELKEMVLPLESKYFPTSAIVTVKDGETFLAELASHGEMFETQVLHKPPADIQKFVDVLLVVFSALWLMTLTLVIYFNLERITVKEEVRWSLMKMLGARPLKLFLPLWFGQALRISVAATSAILLFSLISTQIGSFFVWNWLPLPSLISVVFFAASLFVTSLISSLLFFNKFQRVAIG